MRQGLIWLVIIISFLYNAQISSSEEVRQMSYGDFIEEIRKGNIVSVEVKQYSKIEGLLKEGDSTIPFRTYHEDPNNDKLLLGQLETKDEAVSLKGGEEARNRYEYFTFYRMYTLLLPIVMLIFLILIHKRVKNIERTTKELPDNPQ